MAATEDTARLPKWAQHPYERWAAFCDAAQVAPDTLKSYDELAERYGHLTGIAIQSGAIAELDPASGMVRRWRKLKAGHYECLGRGWRVVNARAAGGTQFRDVWVIEQDSEGCGNWAEVVEQGSYLTMREARTAVERILSGPGPIGERP